MYQHGRKWPVLRRTYPASRTAEADADKNRTAQTHRTSARLTETHAVEAVQDDWKGVLHYCRRGEQTSEGWCGVAADGERIIRTSPQRLSRQVWESGRPIQNADVSEVRVDQVAAPDGIALALGVPAGERVLRRSRTYEIDGQPVQTATSYLPLNLADGTPIAQADTGPGGTYARLAELGHAPIHFTEDVLVRPATIAESDRLDLRLSESIIQITRIASDAGGRIVEINEMILHSRRYQLRYEFEA